MLATQKNILALMLTSAVALGAMAATADAKKRVAVLDVEGARTSSLEKSLAKLVGADNRVITSRVYRKTAKRLKARKLSPRHIKRVAEKLRADGVLEGMIVAEDGQYILRLRLHEGASGRTVKKLTVRLKRPRLSRKIRAALSRKLADAIDDLRFNDGEIEEEAEAAEDAAAVAGDDDDGLSAREQRRAEKREQRAEKRRRAQERAERRAEKRAERKAEKRAEKRRRAEEKADRRRRAKERKRAKAEKRRRLRERRLDRDEDDEFADEDTDDTDDEESIDSDADDEEALSDINDINDDDDDADDSDEDTGIGARVDRRLEGGDAAWKRRHGVMAVMAGLSVVDRRLSFQSRADLAANDAPTGYKGPTVPAARIAGELYPLASNPERRGLAANIGFVFELESVFGLETQVKGAEMGANLATTERRYSAGIVMRYNFGHTETKPSVKVSVGYGKLKFALDKPEGMAVDLPNTTYRFISPGLELRVPLARSVAVTAGGKAMLINSAGEISERAEYGTATLTGVDATVGIEYVWSQQLLVRLAGRYTAVGFDFSGDGEMVVMRDGDASTVDVGGALDRYIGGSLTAGYLF